MKLIKPFVFSVFAAGSLIACGSTLAQSSTAPAAAPAASPTAPATSPNTSPTSPTLRHRPMSADRLAEILHLTDAQKAQVQTVLDTERQNILALHQDTSLTPAERRAKMQQIRDAVSAQLQPILTPEQFAKWQNLTHSHHMMPKAMTPGSTNAPAGSGQ